MRGLEWSRGKVRPKTPRALGKDNGVAALRSPDAEDAVPQNDPITGRIVNGKLAARRRCPAFPDSQVSGIRGVHAFLLAFRSEAESPGNDPVFLANLEGRSQSGRTGQGEVGKGQRAEV